MEVHDQLHVPATLPPRNNPRPMPVGLFLVVGLDAVGKRETLPQPRAAAMLSEIHRHQNAWWPIYSLILAFCRYVQFKKVPGGSKNESCIVNGVVCSKNVAHRTMSTELTAPRILLLGCSLVYQRIEGRRSSWFCCPFYFIHLSWVRFLSLPDFLRSSGSGTGSTQPREYNWGATWKGK
jgi:hypothetical protein